MPGVKFGKLSDRAKEKLIRGQAARDSGYKFIEIMLLDRRYAGMLGAEVLHGAPYTDDATQTTKYNITKSGGPLRFFPDDERGGEFCVLPDTEWNRKFLRGLIGKNIYEITDKKLETDIGNGVPADEPYAGTPTAAPAPQTMTIAELTAALNKARAAEGLPPVNLLDAAMSPPVDVAPAVPVEPSGEGEGEGVTVENTTMPVAPVAVNGAASGAKRGFPTRRTPKSGLVTITE